MGCIVADRDVFPPWLMSWDALADTFRYRGGRALFAVAFHAVRLPNYWARLVAHSPRGVWVVVRSTVRAMSAASDRQTLEALRAAAHNGSGAVALARAQAAYHRRLAWLAVWSLVGLVVVVVGVLAVWDRSGVAARAGLVVGVPAVFGAVGAANQPAPILDPIHLSGDAPPLTKGLIVEALDSLGIARLTAAIKADPVHGVRMLAPVMRDGNGYRAEIELPSGVTAGDVAERRAALASGLKRQTGQVWPSGAEGRHEGALTLFVSDEPMGERAMPKWPLISKGTVDIFRPFPIGCDPQGQPVEVTLMYASGVIGAIPRMGKTATARLLACAAALDVRTQLHIFDLKGGPDFLALGAVAHTLRLGDDDEDIAAAVETLAGLRAEVRRRYKLLRSMVDGEAPDARLTSELASRRDLDLAPVLVLVDECQVWFEHRDHGKELAALAEDLIRRGPAVGVMAIFSTQRVDAKSLPTGISSNAVLRFALKVTGQVENDMVLGTSMYKAGIRATEFGRSDLGVCWLAGEGNDPRIVQTHYVDLADTARIAERARAARQRSGWLSGMAAGEEPDLDQSTIVDHVAMIWPAGVDRMWTSEILDALAGRWPGAYGDWTVQTLGSALADNGLQPKNIRRAGKTRKGITATDFAAVYQSAAAA